MRQRDPAFAGRLIPQAVRLRKRLAAKRQAAAIAARVTAAGSGIGLGRVDEARFVPPPEIEAVLNRGEKGLVKYRMFEKPVSAGETGGERPLRVNDPTGAHCDVEDLGIGRAAAIRSKDVVDVVGARISKRNRSGNRRDG